MNSIYTAYYDLIATTSLLNIKNNKKFSAVPVYPLFRDVCLMIYQINKDILDDSIHLDPTIKKIRHRVKLFQKKDNYKVYNRIVDIHTYQFGNDIDNLGFYLEDDKLIGSTIYSTYIFQETHFFSTNPKETGEKGLAFAKLVGETAGLIVEKLIEKSNHTLPLIDPPTFVYKDDEAYKEKDILSTKFYGEEQNHNVTLTRLVISLQEASTCIWLHKGISNNNYDKLQFENYILLRLLTIKADEVMDNLKNMRRFLPDNFNRIDKDCQFKLSKIMNNFDRELEEECRVLRNMVHYNEERENFLDYVDSKIRKDKNYINTLTYKIVNDYMKPLNNIVSDYLQINNIKSMNDFEKITRRVFSLVKRRNFRSS
ncbi:DNA polymerase III subunit gamma/tau [Virgibacillus halodenitrificans]|uniref:DNA polymerase III subunit gamma/tau n=1 Tax=Virgibacillus halodenitrificans TaxID=1482 RepID=UPI00136D91E2|nr:DNA polymerase III subunit gamma/tau [Virgibacillus halodenitrificans]MYL47662.1 DNA polymerase III subunit gamma/tau [Virgibacillus halodenitrificans]